MRVAFSAILIRMTKPRRFVLGLAVALALLSPFALAQPVAAHEHVTVGTYAFTVGWRIEPALTGVLNGLDMGIEQNLSGTMVAVLGAEANLTATLTTGPASVVKAIEPQDNRPGWYTFDVIPTRIGTYTVHVTGTLNATAIDITVALDDVAAASDVQFPVPDPTATDLSQQLAQVSAQFAALQSQLAVLIVVASIGTILAAAALVMSTLQIRRQRAKT